MSEWSVDPAESGASGAASALRTELQAALGDAYIIEEEMPAGGMSRLFLAAEPALGRRVVVKLLPPEYESQMSAARFRQEMAVTARLQHPHVLPVLTAGVRGGLLYYVTPYVAGESLRARLRREGALAIDDAVGILREVADALAYAHAQGVIHRDIKPENILLAAGGHAVLADFGIARAASAVTRADSLTMTGMSLGTPGYMAPEQLFGSRDVDARTDLYALGVVAYEMLAGRPPFQGANVQALLAAHLTDEPAPLVGERSEVPASLSDVVARAMAKDPAARFASAAEFAAAVSAAAASVGAGAAARGNAVAVLDFANLSCDPALDWLSSGIAETVSVDLAKLSGFRVIGRDRVHRALAGAREGAESGDVVRLGRALGARWVVRGGFQRVGSAVRLTPQFADTETGEISSAAKIDGTMEEIFTLQDRVVTALLEVMRVEPSTAEMAKIARGETGRLQAYEYYAKGRQHMRQFGARGFEEAMRLFQQAVDVDPNYALAYSGMGAIRIASYIAHTRREDFEAGLSHLERARSLDPDLAEPHQWLAYVYVRLHRFDDAERAATRALEMEPDRSGHHYMAGTVSLARALIGHRPEFLAPAVAGLARAVALEPGMQSAHMGLGWLYMLNGQHGAAREALDSALRFVERRRIPATTFVGALALRGALHLRDGELDEAEAVLRRALVGYTTDDHMYSTAFTSLSHALLGETALRRTVFDRAVEHFIQARDTIADNADKLASGHLLLRARLGLAKAFRRLGMRKEETREFELAVDLLERRTGYDFNWMWEGCDAHSYYALASYLAAAGRSDEAFAALAQAARCAWGDLPELMTDPSFARYPDDPRMRAISDTVEARGRIPEYPMPR